MQKYSFNQIQHTLTPCTPMIKKSEINTTVILLLDLGAVGAGAVSATVGARLQWARL